MIVRMIKSFVWPMIQKFFFDRRKARIELSRSMCVRVVGAEALTLGVLVSVMLFRLSQMGE